MAEKKTRWDRLRAWWTRPAPKLRVLAVLRDAGSELRGMVINQTAKTWSIYQILAELQTEGLVESREAPEIPPVQFGLRTVRFRVYRLTPEGFRVARGVDWCP